MALLDRRVMMMTPGQGVRIRVLINDYERSHPKMTPLCKADRWWLANRLAQHMRARWWVPGVVDIERTSRGAGRWVKRAGPFVARETKTQICRRAYQHLKRSAVYFPYIGKDDVIAFLEPTPGGDPETLALIERVLNREVPDVEIEKVVIAPPGRRPGTHDPILWLIGKGPMVCGFFNEGWTVDEIASAMGVAPRYVRIVINQQMKYGAEGS